MTGFYINGWICLCNWGTGQALPSRLNLSRCLQRCFLWSLYLKCQFGSPKLGPFIFPFPYLVFLHRPNTVWSQGFVCWLTGFSVRAEALSGKDVGCLFRQELCLADTQGFDKLCPQCSWWEWDRLAQWLGSLDPGARLPGHAQFGFQTQYLCSLLISLGP